MTNHKRRRAFTLVEIQIASAIAFMIFLATLSLYMIYSRIITTGNTMLDVYSNSRIAMALIGRDLRCAAQVEASYTSGGTTYTTSDSSIVLKVPSIDSAGDVISAQHDEIIYQLQGSLLYRIVIPHSAGATPSSRIAVNRAVARYCTSLTFSSGGTPLSEIGSSGLSALNTIAIRLPMNQTITSLSGAGAVAESMTPTTVVRMRNK